MRNYTYRTESEPVKCAGIGPGQKHPLDLANHGGKFFGQEVLELMGALVGSTAVGLLEPVAGPVRRAESNTSPRPWGPSIYRMGADG
jgi:hypothetical protein